GVTRMNDRISSSLQAPRFRTLLLTGFAILSLLLAAGGLYATMLYAVGQRKHEIGIRVALGADSAAVLSLVVRQGMKLTVVGIAIGLAATLVTSHVLDNFLFGVESTDPATLAAISVVLTAVALLACYLPARRAARIDPMVALRGE
ncbi:MAG: FtsX-like permease family protein, partial [Gemmatimonadota bacterium]